MSVEPEKRGWVDRARALLRYATTQDAADNPHEGYSGTTLKAGDRINLTIDMVKGTMTQE